jgi:hypothetical protein
MIRDFTKCREQYDHVVSEAENLSSIARDSELQRIAIAGLSDMLDELSGWKHKAVVENNEELANLILAMECGCESLEAELTMWLHLKSEKPEEAWAQLIAAQTATAHAVRAHQAFAHLENHARYLDAIEKVVFPRQVFLSAGMIVRRQICSICNQEYEDCQHLVGLPYWGEFCVRILEKISMDHVAIVDNPANKLCRITHFSTEGGKRNRMTWRVEASAAAPSHSSPQAPLKG